jgi:hypothetical protein
MLSPEVEAGNSILIVEDDLGWYCWDGGYDTSWYVDHEEELIRILIPSRLGFPQCSACPSLFLDLGLPVIDD